MCNGIEILQEVRRAGMVWGIHTCPLFGPTAMPLRSVLVDAIAAEVGDGVVVGR